MVSFHTDHNNVHYNNKLQLTISLIFPMGTCADTDTVLEIYSWDSLNDHSAKFSGHTVEQCISFMAVLNTASLLEYHGRCGFLCNKAHTLAVAIKERCCIFYLAVTM